MKTVPNKDGAFSILHENTPSFLLNIHTFLIFENVVASQFQSTVIILLFIQNVCLDISFRPCARQVERKMNKNKHSLALRRFKI